MDEALKDKDGNDLNIGDTVLVRMVVKEFKRNQSNNTLLLTADPSLLTLQGAYLECCSTSVAKQ